MIGQKVDMWQKCQWSAQPINHSHFRELFSNTMKTDSYTQLLKMGNIKTNNKKFNSNYINVKM